MTFVELPNSAVELVAELEKVYRPPVFTPEDNLATIMFKSGQWDVVQTLAQRLKAKERRQHQKGGVFV